VKKHHSSLPGTDGKNEHLSVRGAFSDSLKISDALYIEADTTCSELVYSFGFVMLIVIKLIFLTN
jgi:hypothetical protein